MTGDDEAFCAELLPRVSRTFAAGIASLPDALRRPTTIGYLLCRASGAIEDQTSLGIAERAGALTAWRAEMVAAASLARSSDAGVPRSLARALPLAPTGGSFPSGLVGTSEADAELLRERARVLRELARLPRDVAHLVAGTAVEMAEGMGLFLQDDATRPIGTWDDLDRYCYFVAGTVGHMLTGLFLAGRGAYEREAQLVARASAFGRGLQLVNIAKDAARDLTEERCFLPREAWPPGFDGRFRGEVPATLARPILAVVARARRSLDDANAYLLALPADALAARKFCGMALHLAVRTLAVCEASTTLTDPARPPKVSRDAVLETVAWLDAHAGDDAALAERFVALQRG